MNKEKALYQVKLVLDTLEESEYKKIPTETIKYIEDNMEYDENIKIDPNIPLEEQDIDDYTCDFLENIIKIVEEKEKYTLENNEQEDIESLKLLIKKLQIENEKIPKVKEIINEYKVELEKKNVEINELKKQNEELYNSIKKLPRFVRKIFFREFENVPKLNERN